MKTLQTIAGNNYVVYSKNGGTVTDASGTLNKTVEAGDFLFIPAAPSDMLMCDDDESVIKQANFKRAALALGLLGGGADKLPAGYTRLEFLESTGTQYLVLPVMFKDTSGFAVRYKVGPSANFDYLSIIRYRGKNVEIGRIAEDGKTGISTSSPTVTAFVENNGRIFATYNEYASKKMKVATQGEETETDIPHTPAVGVSVTPVYLMAYDRASNLGVYLTSQAHYSLYEARFTLGPKLVNRFVPAVDPTGAPCMFDLVSKQPSYNNGTGDFLYPGKETTATTYSLRRPRMYAQMTEHGIRRLYHVPRGYNGTPEEYAEEHGFKILVETPAPEDGYWAPVWHDREDCIELEWVETESPAEEKLLTEA